MPSQMSLTTPWGGASPTGLQSVEEPRTVHQTVVGNFTTAFRIKPHGRLAAGPTRAAPPTPAPPQFLGKGPTLKGSEIEPRGAPWWRGGLGICGYHCCARVTAGAQVRPPRPTGRARKQTNQPKKQSHEQGTRHTWAPWTTATLAIPSKPVSQGSSGGRQNEGHASHQDTQARGWFAPQ